MRFASPRLSSDPDRRLLRRAAGVVAAQTAAAVALVVLAMTGAVLLIDEHQQHLQADQASRVAWASADDVVDPPAGVLLVAVTRDGRIRSTEGAPAAVSSIDPRRFPDGIFRTVREGRELVLFTGERGIGRVSAVYDLSPREVEEHRLRLSLGIAALFGVAGAAVVGALIGRRAVRPLGEAIALQRRFVADASHELRTPLSVLLMRAQLLRRHLGDTLSAQRAADLDRLVLDAKVLGDVVNDLLLSVELGQRSQGGERVELADLAADVVASLQPLAVQRSVELATDPLLSAVSVSGAKAALRRSLVSLVDNAISHTPPGGHVRVGVAANDAQVTISVVDDGEGLDPRLAPSLVKRFSRGTETGAGRRFGLGLALVDEVARAHGGTLIVDGQPGAGACFRLVLPC